MLDPSGSFTVNGVSIAWQNTDTLTTIINRINSSTAGVVASYDSSNDRMTLSNANTGNQSISLADNAPTGSGLLKALGVSAANQTVPTISGTAREGQALTADPGGWSGQPTFAYQWLNCSVSAPANSSAGARSVRIGRPRGANVAASTCSARP